ncbi:protein CA_C1420-like isoform X2 [Mercenaria mercenaria]|uniref:protein CA_C1420-like isoform X2 n=1 Tax=Mercenaria mercenaria TaxID=6596 RepID=UPI00234F97CC|nr:protein CA_C1420-like isoform X2 [Mercenaria mercenaria]
MEQVYSRSYRRCVLIIFLLSFCCFIGYTNCKVVGGFVLPHGGVALDPRNFNTRNQTERDEAKTLHEACLKVGRDVKDLKPDIIFLSTPHGLSDYRNFLLYSNAMGSGYGDADDCLVLPCRYNLSVEFETQIASMVTKLFGYSRNVSLLTAFGPEGNENSISLRWGEVIPLLFVGNMSISKIVILSQPTRRYTDSVHMIPELIQLGNDLFRLLDESPQRIAVIISSDLAHTHKADGPYGYSNASQPFDDAVGKWASTLDFNFLVKAGTLVDRALSCGYTGLVMLHGMLSHLDVSSWTSTVYANLHPSYYGMMAASFHRNDILQ